MSFAETLKQLRGKAGKSRYKLAQWSGLSEAYLLRLETGERANPSREVVLMLALALVVDCIFYYGLIFIPMFVQW